MDATADYTNYGETAGDHFGWSVGYSGDLDQDTYNEAIIGAPDFGNDAGKVYIICVPEFPVLMLPVILLLMLIVVRKKVGKLKKMHKKADKR